MPHDEVVHFICPDKYRAWNLLPCKEDGFGSIEFCRPRGVVNAKQAKRWIVFTMAFVNMAIEFRVDGFICYVRSNPVMSDMSFADSESKILQSARIVNCYAQLDPRFKQSDNLRILHMTVMDFNALCWLQQHDRDYQSKQ